MPRDGLRRRCTASSSTSACAFAEVLLKSGLVLPALDHCLKCSHLFNLLDSSGGVGVGRRAHGLQHLRVRQLALGIARLCTESAAQADARGRPRPEGA